MDENWAVGFKPGQKTPGEIALNILKVFLEADLSCHSSRFVNNEFHLPSFLFRSEATAPVVSAMDIVCSVQLI